MYQQQMNQQGIRQNQQNPQGYPMQQNPQSRQNQHCQLSDQDLLNTVLAEMRRISREYTTAILEASNPSIRENFYSLLDRTLQDQELLYTLMENMNMFGPRSTASQKEIQREEQQHRQRAIELQFFLQQNLGQGNSPGINNQPNYYQPDEQLRQFQTGPYNQPNPWDVPNQQYQQYPQSQQNLQGQQNRQGQQGQQYQQYPQYSQNQQNQYQQYQQYPQSPQNQQFQQSPQNQQNQQFQQDQPNQSHPSNQMNEQVQTNPTIHEKEAETNKEAAQSAEKTPSEFSTPTTDMYQSAANKTEFNTTGSRQANSQTTGAEPTQPATKKPKASK